MFNAEHEIQEFYVTTFKESITQAVVSRIRVQITDNLAAAPEEGSKQEDEEFEVPEFLKTYFVAQCLACVETKLLPEFQRKFTLPKEEEWQAFLEEQMPIYKRSHKQAGQRKMPFDTKAEPLPRLLEFSLLILESLPIQDFAKLDLEYAPSQIREFKEKHGISGDCDKTVEEIVASDLEATVRQNANTYVETRMVLYQLLFVVFTHFMETKYCGITRQLVKMFMRRIEPTVRQLLILEGKQTINFLIAIFEMHVCDAKIKRDAFDLKQMRNILITDENAKKMNLLASLEKTTVC